MLYRTGKLKCQPFSKPGDVKLKSGTSRNYEIFDPLDFLAEVTQHIPNKGQHQIHYYGSYSNKKRGLRAKTDRKPVPSCADKCGGEPGNNFMKKRRMTSHGID